MTTVKQNNNNNFNQDTIVNSKIISIVNDSSLHTAHRRSIIEANSQISKLDQVNNIVSNMFNLTGSIKYKEGLTITENNIINLNHNKITNVKNPNLDHDAVNKKFLDSKINLFNNILSNL